MLLGVVPEGYDHLVHRDDSFQIFVDFRAASPRQPLGNQLVVDGLAGGGPMGTEIAILATIANDGLAGGFLNAVLRDSSLAGEERASRAWIPQYDTEESQAFRPLCPTQAGPKVAESAGVIKVCDGGLEPSTSRV